MNFWPYVQKLRKCECGFKENRGPAKSNVSKMLFPDKGKITNP